MGSETVPRYSKLHARTMQLSAYAVGCDADHYSCQTSAMFSNIAPNYSLSGALAKDTNVFKGVVIKYNEPAEAQKPNQRWFLYPFKGQESLEAIPIYRQSAYLLGRDRTVADIPTDHPSCSSQHAVIQFRKVNGRVKPYIIDLESANKTKLNDEILEPRRYYELLEKDVIKFGFSTREYVVMNENCINEPATS